MSETIEEFLQETLEGQLIALQILLLELGRSNAIDVERYLALLLDYRNKHVKADSGTEIVLDRIVQIMTGEQHIAPLARRMAMKLVERDTPADEPSGSDGHRSE